MSIQNGYAIADKITGYPNFNQVFDKKFENPNVATIHVDDSGRVFLKGFVINSKVNGHGWAVDESYIPYAMNASIGHPLTLRYDPVSGSFSHPIVKGASLAVDRVKQMDYSIGHMVYPFDTPNENGDWFGVYEIMEPASKQLFTDIAKGLQDPIVPFFTSACISHSKKENPQKIKVFTIEHNTITDKPAYGDVARITGICEGDYGSCLAELKTASMVKSETETETESSEPPNNSNDSMPTQYGKRCGFCAGSLLTKIFKKSVSMVSELLSNGEEKENASYIVRTASENLASSMETELDNNKGDQSKDPKTNDAVGNITPEKGKTGADNKANQTGTDFTKMTPQQFQDLMKKSVDQAVAEANKNAADKLESFRKQIAGESKTPDKKESQLDADTESRIKNLESQLKAEKEKNEENTKKLSKYELKEKKEEIAETLLQYEDRFKDPVKGTIDESRFERVVDFCMKKNFSTAEIKEYVENIAPIPVVAKASMSKYYGEQGLTARELAESQGYSAPPTRNAASESGGQENDFGEDNLEEDKTGETPEEDEKETKSASMHPTDTILDIDDDPYLGLSSQIVHKANAFPFGNRRK